MKKVLLIMVSILLIFLLAACQTSNEQINEKEDEQVAPQQQNRPMHMGRGHMQASRNMDIPASTGENELNIPPLLESDREEGNDIYYTVEAQKGESEIFPGIKTNTLGYNGNFLGPAIRLKEGQNAHFTLKNNLEEDTTFHWHGLIVGGNADGGPHDVIRPKEERDISFPVQQSAATLWFHPHPLGNTAKQVYEGLAGLLLIESGESSEYVYGENDFPLIIQDKMFTDDKQLDYGTAYHPNGTFGNTILINGTVNPKLTIPKEKVRLRLLNGSNSRGYTFSLSNGESFQQIASDGGLLNKAVEKTSITLTPSERAEIIVDFSQMEDDVSLIAGENLILMPFAFTDDTTENIPGNLEQAERVKVTEAEKNLPVTKEIELFGMGHHVTINGKTFDPDRIDFTQKKGETEIWEVYNKPDHMGGSIHPFHIHGTQFKIVSINDEEPPAQLQGYKDTVSLNPGDKAKIAVKFDEAGIYMYHCHILEHEDNGMMGQVQVE